MSKASSNAKATFSAQMRNKQSCLLWKARRLVVPCGVNVTAEGGLGQEKKVQRPSTTEPSSTLLFPSFALPILSSRLVHHGALEGLHVALGKLHHLFVVLHPFRNTCQ